MPMSTSDCIDRLLEFLDQQEKLEEWLLSDDEFAEGDPVRYKEELREVERDIEAIKRAIRALERSGKQKKIREGEH